MITRGENSNDGHLSLRTPKPQCATCARHTMHTKDRAKARLLKFSNYKPWPSAVSRRTSFSCTCAWCAHTLHTQAQIASSTQVAIIDREVNFLSYCKGRANLVCHVCLAHDAHLKFGQARKFST